MKFFTKVNVEDFNDRISYKDKIISLGSCFANEIGAKLKDSRFDILVNPFGVLYNPASIASAIERLSSGNVFSEEDIFTDGDLWRSFYHDSLHAEYTKEALINKINTSLKYDSMHFITSSWVLVTLGTRRVYTLKKKNIIVSNCHKLPQSEFEIGQLKIDDIIKILAPYIEANLDKTWLFTVSPVRYLKDGAHDSQISKATLLLAVEELTKLFSNVIYFPAYEIFMDELRDYRYYAEDLIHPSQSSLKYIWEIFRDSLINKENYYLLDMVGRLNDMKNHHPFFSESKAFKKFKAEMLQLEEIIDKQFKEKM